MPASSSFVSSFSIASLAQAIAAPFTALTAYSAGAIDEQGNLLKPESSIDPFEYFVIKLKKIFSELPMSYTKARLANYSSAFQYFTEQAKSFGISEIEFIMFMEGYIQGGKLLNEDMGVGAMGGAGAPGSLSTPSEYESKGGVAGYDVRMAAPLFRRTPVEIFDVDPDEFDQFKNAKAWKHIQDSATKRYLQRFQRRNPNGKMALKTKRPDTDEHELYWITYAPKSFMEEYHLNNFDFLVEEIDYSNQFRDHISALFKKVQEKKSSKDKNKNAAVAELHARIFNHINNFTKVRSNPNALKHYMEHAGVSGILGNTDSNSQDTHIITGFDEKNLPIIKTFDVKNVEKRGGKNVYVRQHLSSEDISNMERHTPTSAWATERVRPQNLKTSDRLYRRGKGLGITQRLKQDVESYLGQAKEVKNSLIKKLSERAQSKQYMIHENGEFYLVDHNHFDIANPEINVNWGTPTYRTEGRKRAEREGKLYVDPHANFNLGRGQASLRAGLKDTFRDEKNKVKLDTSGLQDIESMLDDESKKHFSEFVKTYT
jgi:hypothetical protein